MILCESWNEWKHESDWNATWTWYYLLWWKTKESHQENINLKKSARLTAKFRWIRVWERERERKRERMREKLTTWEGTMDGREEVSERNLPPLDWGHILTSLHTHTHWQRHRIITRNKLVENCADIKKKTTACQITITKIVVGCLFLCGGKEKTWLF